MSDQKRGYFGMYGDNTYRKYSFLLLMKSTRCTKS